MYGVIGKIIATKGNATKLIGLLESASKAMPGCRSYVIARDKTDADAVWISEIWESEEDHKSSLNLPQVQAAINEAMPIISAMGERFETIPVSGF